MPLGLTPFRGNAAELMMHQHLNEHLSFEQLKVIPRGS
jgi:hypothetical protein